MYHRSSILSRVDCAFVFVFSYHMDCLTPPAEFVPLDEWFCPSCSSYQEPEEQEDDRPTELTRARTTRGRPRGSTARRVSILDRTGTVDVDFKYIFFFSSVNCKDHLMVLSRYFFPCPSPKGLSSAAKIPPYTSLWLLGVKTGFGLK